MDKFDISCSYTEGSSEHRIWVNDKVYAVNGESWHDFLVTIGYFFRDIFRIENNSNLIFDIAKRV